MVDRARELENALGTGIKTVEKNEKETVVLQRRAVRVKRELESGTVITEDMLEELRPAPVDAVFPYQKGDILGRRLIADKEKGDYIKWNEVGEKQC